MHYALYCTTRRTAPLRTTHHTTHYTALCIVLHYAPYYAPYSTLRVNLNFAKVQWGQVWGFASHSHPCKPYRNSGTPYCLHPKPTGSSWSLDTGSSWPPERASWVAVWGVSGVGGLGWLPAAMPPAVQQGVAVALADG